MHIKVNDILAQEVGYQTDLEFSDETIESDDMVLTKPVGGELSLLRTSDGLLARGQAETAIELECHRCLRAFAHPLRVRFGGEFTLQPDEDQWPITKDDTIDLAPLIRQELLLALPIKQLCQEDCPGLCLECGQRLDKQHKSHKKEN